MHERDNLKQKPKNPQVMVITRKIVQVDNQNQTVTCSKYNLLFLISEHGKITQFAAFYYSVRNNVTGILVFSGSYFWISEICRRCKV